VTEPARVVPVKRLELAFRPRPWPFATERRADIDAHFARARRDKPGLWNGRVLLLHEFSLHDGILRGAFLETDFASFMAWRDWEAPDRGVRNAFAAGALRARDGAFLLAVMGSHTANAGKIYFPCGTPDPGDIVGDRIDLDGSVQREVSEETGLGSGDYTPETGWHAFVTGAQIALIKMLHCATDAEPLRARIRRTIASQSDAELADVRIVRQPGDFDRNMPPFVTTFLQYVWQQSRRP